jgi:phosphoglycolate phosphatase-like HAD superfamily hydrolase
MERLGIHHVARVLVAGDTTRDLEAGTNSGAGFVVGVLTGGQDAAALGAVRHTHLLPSAALLPELMLEAEATDHR